MYDMSDSWIYPEYRAGYYDVLNEQRNPRNCSVFINCRPDPKMLDPRYRAGRIDALNDHDPNMALRLGVARL